MTTITRDELQAMWIAEQVRKQDETIKRYVKAITADVIAHNNAGNKKCKKVLYKETDFVKTQVVQQLKSVFVDSKIIYSDTDQSITVDWSLD
jgi:hypothetical protein